MILFRRLLMVNALRLFDLVTASACLGVAGAAVRYRERRFSLEGLLSISLNIRQIALFVATVAGAHLLLTIHGGYRSRRLSRWWHEAADVIRAAAGTAALLYLLGTASHEPVVDAWFALAYFISLATATLLGRILLHAVLARVRLHGRNLRQAVIVGTNRRALAFARQIEGRPEWGYRLVGFVDDRDWDSNGEFDRSGYPLISDLAGFSTVLRRQVVDAVVVFLPLKSHYRDGQEIVRGCQEQGVCVEFPSTLFDFKNSHATAAEVASETILSFSTGAMRGWPVLVKRVLDIILSACFLALLSPLLLSVALLISVTSGPPVLFVQERLGLNKRRFRIYKFRTMVVNAERRMREIEHLNEASGPVFKIRKDPRITRLGAFLRKTSIDELPQLLNVLKGDLSLVGPRPLPVRDYEGFERDWHRRRFSVRPGITCLWQIGGRSNVSFDKWMELDVEYIDNWSIWLDLKILAKTIPAVLKGTGAA